MPEELLHATEVRSPAEQFSRKRMTHRMGRYVR